MPSAVAVALLTFLAACGGPGREVRVEPARDSAVTVRIRGYRFDPSLIRVPAGARLAVRVVNETPAEHTWTLRAPDGTVWVNLVLPGGEAARTVVDLAQPGVYEFYCDRTFHPLLGMRGEIRAETEP